MLNVNYNHLMVLGRAFCERSQECSHSTARLQMRSVEAFHLKAGCFKRFNSAMEVRCMGDAMKL